MGDLKADWLTSVENLLIDQDIQAEALIHEYFYLLLIGNGKLILNLVSLEQDFVPEKFIVLQQHYQEKNIQVIHLWQDVFLTKKTQVINRIKAILGLNKRIHGRSTSIEKISKIDAAAFLNQYHLQGDVGARYRYGLVYENELVAVATFSNKRKMNKMGADYTSTELIRFATKENFTVIGGLSKLLKHYVKAIAPNDVMSYADRDWSIGKSYLSSGFKLKAETSPAILYLDQETLQRYFTHRKPVQQQGGAINQYIEVFNTGNLKYVLVL
ncbi:hypothetical protein AAKU52_001583 [Pedobacter sp. CG_S7]|uniref:hypothetical protein n=1 Tax=Pedobacter sp. CG_S7 TaxID=3143930 RepID=UPI0033913067